MTLFTDIFPKKLEHYFLLFFMSSWWLFQNEWPNLGAETTSTLQVPVLLSQLGAVYCNGTTVSVGKVITYWLSYATLCRGLLPQFFSFFRGVLYYLIAISYEYLEYHHSTVSTQNTRNTQPTNQPLPILS